MENLCLFLFLSKQQKTAPPHIRWSREKFSSASVPEIGLVLQADVCRLEHGIVSSLSLGHVIVERVNSRLAQNDDHRQVDKRHYAHKYVGNIPDKAKIKQRAHKNDNAGNEVENYQRCLTDLTASNIVQTALTIKQITKKCGKGKEQQRKGETADVLSPFSLTSLMDSPRVRS